MRQLPLILPVAISVSEMTRYLRELLESDEILRDVWVQGEVSNLSRPSSGHIYFTLKDSSAALRCVIWKSAAMRIRFPLQNGMLLEAHGYISLYERDGAYQLYVDTLKPVGEGALFQEFLRLKARLEAEGLFASERKRPMPALPGVIGIVTSATGAALQDMLNTLKQRYRLAEVIIAPTSVQGEEAPAEIVRAIRRLNRQYHPDVIIVARGGGSLEDLWAFNDEAVVREIAASEAPVICGVGHETDFTLADFAADLRAPTPTGAAVMATPNQDELLDALSALSGRFVDAFEETLQSRQQALVQSRIDLQRLSPARRLQNEFQRLDDISGRLERSGWQRLTLEKTRWQALGERLNSLNPNAVLQRGYAIIQKADGRLVKYSRDVESGEAITLRVSDGAFNAEVK
jgi:exodeoxyribonuclease VII large subunit